MASVSDAVDLPAGFRFYPTDEEIITHYLSQKVFNPSFSATAVGEVDLNKCEPWDLPSKAKMGEKDWYFFCQRDKKYPTGMRTNRATESGYWKATGKDKKIFRGKVVLVGMKKTLVFYMGRAPKGVKTNWVMHEFRLEGKQPTYTRTTKDEWAVCKVFHKSIALVEKSPLGEALSELPPLMDPTLFSSFSGPELGYVNNSDGLSYVLPSIHDNVGIFNPPQSSGFCSQIQTSSSYLQLQGLVGAGYLHQNLSVVPALATTDDITAAATLRGHCKVEKFSSHLMSLGEIRPSTDRSTKISLVASKHNIDSSHRCEDLDYYDDLDTIWSC